MPARDIDPRWWSEASWNGVPLADVLRQRDVTSLFLFLRSRGITRASIAAQTGLAENRVRAISQGQQQVTAYDVLERIAEGLTIPRAMMGLGTADDDIASISPASMSVRPRIAICGSRHRPGTNEGVIDVSVQSLAETLRDGQLEVLHGPVGVGVEVMTYIANNYRPAHLRRTVGIFGHANVVRDVRLAVIVGGGRGTHDEIDLALEGGTRLLPLNASGGAAQRAYLLMRTDVSLRSWIAEADFAALEHCADMHTITDVTRRLITACLPGSPP
ncbi:hypothetical protein [Catellatospora sichuanensis]|uniref:hypothetical protein n=1 Tax=Catellatospora sichuanensis TaxID=1969805 RepID=UPI0011830C4E|nr:hypothetical protein [Catellatospora sichuanensis]